MTSLFSFLKSHKPPKILIVNDNQKALKAVEIYKYFALNPTVLPDFRAVYGDDLRSYREELCAIAIGLKTFYDESIPMIVPLKTALTPLFNAQHLNIFSLACDTQVNLNTLKNCLKNGGYEFVDVVVSQGEVSFRGDILDIFPVNSHHPFRVGVLDDIIEDIHIFNPSTQLKMEIINHFDVFAVTLFFDDETYEAINNQCQSSDFNLLQKNIESSWFWFLENKISLFETFTPFFFEDMRDKIDEIYLQEATHLVLKPIIEKNIPSNSDYKELLPTKPYVSFLSFHQDKKITILAKNKSLLKAFELEDYASCLVESHAHFHLFSEKELIISLNEPAVKKKTKKAQFLVDELRTNDYVVHEEYGIGLYRSIQRQSILGVSSEYLHIDYAGGDKLLVPVTNLEVLSRYVSEGGVLPTLDKIGKGSFSKLKSKIKTKLLAIAQNIIDNAASRQLMTSKKINEVDFMPFVQSAQFTYTKDQKQAILDIEADFQKKQPMNRLISADVGFGKTEIALASIYVAIKNGWQCALICPTSLLSNQHFDSVLQRFKVFGFKVGRLDRFVKSRAKTLQALKSGEIDLVIGTHAVFGAEFKKLGLVVIDEEHKFGVKQKDQLKALYKEAHILTMSATPIPRSLNMALSSIKDLSQLETAPSNRAEVKTFVKIYDETAIKEAIGRELRQAGQIFYVFNSIAIIEQKRTYLQKLMPQLRILVLHSKISSDTTSLELKNFITGKYDLLLCTSIVENGIHMPNVNTMIVDGAERFGIADLHQLRGRVGRSHKVGHCYFFVRDKELTNNAKKRLLAMESHSFIGSGSLLACHDLSIRGGGNLLGEAQSGHIKGVGYSLYLKMLEETICELNGTLNKEKSIELKLNVSAFLDEADIQSERLRLEIYRRLNFCETVAEVAAIEAELRERFGSLSPFTRHFLLLCEIKSMGKQLEIKNISSFEQKITLVFKDAPKKVLQSPSRDEDDILHTLLVFLRKAIKI